MNTELAEIMTRPSTMAAWANKVTYKDTDRVTSEDRDISEVVDAWAKKIGETGYDRDHEIATMVLKALGNDVVTAPSYLISQMFDEQDIGEFDDTRTVRDPKNTINVHEAILGGNVDRSFIEHTLAQPTWKSLQAETDITMQDLRRGGYHTVATLISYMQEAFENKRVQLLVAAMDAAIVLGNPNYIAELGAAPTVTSMDALSLYLHDMSDGGRPIAFSQNKYKQAISKLAQADRWPNAADRDMYNRTGFLDAYAGVELIGLSGQKKLPDGSALITDKRVYGVAGKIGSAITRGSVRVLEEEDINVERIHIKATGFTFGYCITDADKMAKMVMAT